MTPRTHQLLSEKNIYVSWGIMAALGLLIWFSSQTYKSVQDFYPIIIEVQNLKLEQQLTKKDISLIQQRLKLDVSQN